jgi:hypothetical protein
LWAATSENRFHAQRQASLLHSYVQVMRSAQSAAFNSRTCVHAVKVLLSAFEQIWVVAALSQLDHQRLQLLPLPAVLLVLHVTEAAL